LGAENISLFNKTFSILISIKASYKAFIELYEGHQSIFSSKNWLLVKNLLIFLAVTQFVSFIQATPSVNTSFAKTSQLFSTTNDTLPVVFMLGQDDRAFDALKVEHDLQLLAVCRNDMEMTYYLWLQMMKHMESYASQVGYDLNGVKLWIYVFYNKDGSVRHLAYHAKPQSRNFKPEEMTTFLTGFVKTYKLPIGADRSFQHYNVGAFPVMVEKGKDTRSGGTLQSNGAGNAVKTAATGRD
jgi:hypothetical protein